MAREIRKRVGKNGEMLVDFAMELFENRDDKYKLQDRQWAAKFLADRGFGLPIATLELDGMLEIEATPQKLDTSRLAALSAEQLNSLREAITLLRGQRPTALPAPVIDADASEDETSEVGE